MIMKFGKHKGKNVEEVPADYLIWAYETCENLDPTLKTYIAIHLKTLMEEVGEVESRGFADGEYWKD